jgi:hypothetical protein
MMPELTLDPATSNQLRQFKEPVQLRDSRGLPLGTFMPIDEQRLYREIEIPFTTEELKRFASEPGGRTLDEILADLEKQSGTIQSWGSPKPSVA